MPEKCELFWLWEQLGLRPSVGIGRGGSWGTGGGQSKGTLGMEQWMLAGAGGHA